MDEVPSGVSPSFTTYRRGFRITLSGRRARCHTSQSRSVEHIEPSRFTQHMRCNTKNFKRFLSLAYSNDSLFVPQSNDFTFVDQVVFCGCLIESFKIRADFRIR